MFTKIRILNAVDKGLNTNPIKMCMLLRISPGIPWTVYNYMLGVTSCKALPFSIGSTIGSIPKVCMYTYLGVKIKNFKDWAENGEDGGKGPFEIILLVLEVIVMIFVVVFISRESKKELRKIL